MGGDWRKYGVSLLKNEEEEETQTEQDIEQAVNEVEKESEVDGNGRETKKHSRSVSGDAEVAPHRDWSVLAKYLKDSSKEQARRKQILKQLDRILHVREGLIVGFDQLRQIHAKQNGQNV